MCRNSYTCPHLTLLVEDKVYTLSRHLGIGYSPQRFTTALIFHMRVLLPFFLLSVEDSLSLCLSHTIFPRAEPYIPTSYALHNEFMPPQNNCTATCATSERICWYAHVLQSISVQSTTLSPPLEEKKPNNTSKIQGAITWKANTKQHWY